MNLSIKTIFLQENEKNIFQTLQNQEIETEIFEKHFENLFNKLYNNEIGYYIFKQDDLIYRLIILPKTIDKDSITKEKDFVNYLLHYYRVNSKHQFDDTKRIPNSLLSLAFDNINNENNNSHLPLDEFEFYKYEAILYRIERFFKNHKNYKKVTLNYKSQDIKHKLHLANNIKELDKTKIHQIQTVDILYSQIATISYHALKFFKSHRINNINPIYQKDLAYNAKKVISFITKKFTVDKSYKITLSKLNNLKILKVFNVKTETKQLLVDIKSLFGFEQMYQDNEVYVSNRYDLTTTSFFINPSTFYEWYVYDILENTVGHQYSVLFDKHKEVNKKTKTQYDLTSESDSDKKRNSKPDYVLIDEEMKIKVVLDAKWKNIDKLSKISSEDFLKLKLDTDLLNNNGYTTVPYLIYPDYPDENDHIKIAKDDNQYFDFGVLKIDMNFDKEKNSINFKYDFERIEEQIEQEKHEATIQSYSEKFTSKIDIHRSKLITQLLNSGNLENKEEVFSELDNTFLELAEKFHKEIEEVISPEVQEILEIYSEVLEEHSIKFLKSSSAIYNYYKDKWFDHLDYSMPGSGLWKLIELELNSSFVWYVRFSNGVCSKSHALRPLLDKDLERNIKWVKLNEYDNSGTNLKGLMLGQIKFLSGNASVQQYFNNNFISNTLFTLVKNIIDIRNEHAHIKAMSLEKFEELNNLIFQETNETASNLKNLLEFKKSLLRIDNNMKMLR